jgi:hypothetical protein
MFDVEGLSVCCLQQYTPPKLNFVAFLSDQNSIGKIRVLIGDGSLYPPEPVTVRLCDADFYRLQPPERLVVAHLVEQVGLFISPGAQHQLIGLLEVLGEAI